LIYSGHTRQDQNAFRVREHRGKLRRLHRNLYTDDFDRPAEEIVAENILVIAAALLPDWQLSHSSAAVRGPVDGMLFVSGGGKPGRHLHLPGVRIIRLPGLRAPEHDEIPTPTQLERGPEGPPELLTLRVSTRLQTIFECLSTARSYPEKTLPDVAVAELIASLPVVDRERAERFAARNGLRRECLRYRALSFEVATAEDMPLAEPDGASIYFYGWAMGRLTYLGGGEYSFTYDRDWPVALSSELPRQVDPSYEGRGMPAFFENCLPEGWTESVVLASNKLSREDLFGLFTTTRKYLSNLTLRPLGIPEAELVYDAHSVRLAHLPGRRDGVVHLHEEIGRMPEDVDLWRRTRTDGPLRLSGVQAKLPISLFEAEAGFAIRIGDLRHGCTHILKVATHYEGLIENEWATMELARRIGLPVAQAVMVEFQEDSPYRSRSLLVERYDIPDRVALESEGSRTELLLQEDACSLLLLRRAQKYNTSMERIADALLAAGIAPAGERGMRHFLILVLYSWIVGNGDLHAKNVSILRRFRIGRPGEAPTLEGVSLAPFYDIVNTRLHLPGDEFAVPVDGKRSNLRVRSFERLGGRWGMSRDEVRAEAERFVLGVNAHLDPVLSASGLSEELRERFAGIVEENVRTLGV